MSLFNIIIDWLHLLGAATWVGGLIFIVTVFYPVVNQLDPKERAKAIQLMANRFRILVTIAVILLVTTGPMNLPSGYTWSTIHNSKTYFTWLMIKLTFVVIMLVLGFSVPFYLSPKANRLAPQPGEKPSPEFLKTSKQILLVTHMVTGLGILILFFAAVLLNGANF